MTGEDLYERFRLDTMPEWIDAPPDVQQAWADLADELPSDAFKRWAHKTRGPVTAGEHRQHVEQGVQDIGCVFCMRRTRPRRDDDPVEQQ